MSPEYVAEQPLSLRVIAAALDGAFRFGPVSVREEALTVYDTFDGRLAAAGLAVAVTGPEAIPARARALAGRRALLELATVTVRTETVSLWDDLDKTVLRLELISAPGLTPRVRLHGLRGYEAERALIFELLALTEAPLSLTDEAILAAGGRPGGVRAKVRVSLNPGERSDAAVAAICLALWEVVDANLPGTLADTDAEFLHDLRVCVRKTRSVLKELPGVWEPGERARWREEFRWLQQITGESRDLDVALEDLDALAGLLEDETDRRALAPLATVIARRRAAARRIMVRELRGGRARALGPAWTAALTGLPERSEADRPDGATPIGRLAADRILAVARQMVKLGRAIGPDSAPEEYHTLRKHGKELRYLLELFGLELGEREQIAPLLDALKDLQEVLGRHQDREIQAHTLRGMAEEIAALPGGAQALIALGRLLGALAADGADARGEFAAAFGAFAAKPQQAALRTALGR
ncbi:CHAD domain-containing protein [Conexibacter sp. DBS9H8]|uniref:CHAD domain-containing protein n=1 Tax=Conexibacter sp. DBS9H8 TaxID=2937801 RepID=UPI00200BD010|nr:CHAD domain-containing protein [Conexibacter sp. DBS9H8]